MDRMAEVFSVLGKEWDLPPEDRDALQAFDGAVGFRSLPSKTVLLEEGRISHTLYLIKKGCLRLFFTKDGKDITFQFFFEGEWVASFDSLYNHQPSLFSLESIEAAEVFSMEREDFFRLAGQVPGIRKLVEGKLVDRFRNYQMLFLSRIKDSPRQRYEALLAERPDIVRRVPQHYIASYLGMTSVSLSRIRNRRD